RNEFRQNLARTGGPDALGAEHILDRDRHARELAELLAAFALRVDGLRLQAHRGLVEQHERLELRLARGAGGEERVGDLARAGLAFSLKGEQLTSGQFDEVHGSESGRRVATDERR